MINQVLPQAQKQGRTGLHTDLSTDTKLHKLMGAKHILKRILADQQPTYDYLENTGLKNGWE